MIFHSYVTVYQRVIPRFFKDDAVFGSFCLTVRFWKIFLGEVESLEFGSGYHQMDPSKRFNKGINIYKLHKIYIGIYTYHWDLYIYCNIGIINIVLNKIGIYTLPDNTTGRTPQIFHWILTMA
jgi:hypothetical protein